MNYEIIEDFISGKSHKEGGIPIQLHKIPYFYPVSFRALFQPKLINIHHFRGLGL